LGTPAAYYIFFSLFEIAATAAIVWFAWNWKGSEEVAARAREVWGKPASE
jgi:hypothetical protein